ncbi:MAG: glycosyltransferase family 9 protein [Nitrospirae bacterium]|nr:glycosyltransferase family 9 protein [Nitrospirota bacterium]
MKKHAGIGEKPINKILVVKLDHLGDCFLMNPIFKCLNERFPDAVIDVLCLELTSPIFEKNPYIRKVISFNYFRNCRESGRKASLRETFTLSRTLRKEDYDVFIDARGEPFISLLGFLIGAKYRLGFGKEEILGFLYTHPLSCNPHEHEIAKYKIVLDALGVAVNMWEPKIYISENEKLNAQQLLKEFSGKGIIAFHIGAGLPYKMWPIEKFIDFILKLLEHYNYEVILLGGESNRQFSIKIIEKVKSKKVKDLSGRLSIRESYYFLSKTDIFIGNDSVLAHFAGSLNIPTIELMNSAVEQRRWQAIGQRVYVLSGFDKNHKCRLDKCHYPCQNMQAISVEDVFSVFSEIVNKNKG